MQGWRLRKPPPWLPAHADDSDIDELRWSVNQHKHSVSLGNSSGGTGLDFHLVLARASKNQAVYCPEPSVYQQRCIEWNAQSEGILEYSATYADIHEEILHAVCL